MGSLGELYASDGVKEDQLGSAIAAAGGTVVVGEPLDTVGANVRAYVFTEGAGGWATATQTAKLVASNGEAEEAFGASVAMREPLMFNRPCAPGPMPAYSCPRQ